MRFARNIALIGAVGAVFGVALSSPASVSAADVATAKPGHANAVNHLGAEALASAILDRWEPVAIRAGAHSSTWRDVLVTSLKLMDVSVLQFLDQATADTTGNPAAAYRRFTDGVRSAIMQSYQLGLAGKGQVKDLGAVGVDLVFLPVPPCRIVDTRNIGGPPNAGGPIVHGTFREFYYYSADAPWSWATGEAGSGGQGGVAGLANASCPRTTLTAAGGTLGSVAPRAALATVTAVNTTAAGNFNVWGGGGAVPSTSALNWAAGEVLANTTVIPWGGRTGGTDDFAVFYNGPSGQADVVVDLLGYFLEDDATALDCVTVNGGGTSCPAGGYCNDSPAACTAGYTKTGTFCNTSGELFFLTDVRQDICYGHNSDSVTQTITGFARCCRLPGQ